MNNKQKLLVSLLVIMVVIIVTITSFVLYYVYSIKNEVKNEQTADKSNIEESVIVRELPFKLTEESTNVVVFNGYKSLDINYSDMGYFTPQFKYLDLKINYWVLKEEYQKILYDLCKKYNVNYIKALSIIYKEDSRNNPNVVNYNENGTIDIGLSQFNSENIDILKKITGSTDLESLKIPKINLECAVYLMWRNENCYEDVESLYDTIVMYNGGYGSMRNIKDKRYTLNCPASLYAASVIGIMNELYKHYIA